MDCELMEQIATYKPLIILLFSMNILSIITIPLVFFVMIRIARDSLYHLNTRILLVAHGFALIVHMIDRIFYHGNELHRWLIIMPDAGPCEIISSKQRCFILRLGYNFGIYFTVCTTPVLTLERYFATRHFATYQNDRKSWVLLLLIQCMLFILLMGTAYAKTTFEGVSLYCTSVNAEFPMHIFIVLLGATSLQLVSIIGFRMLINKNKKLKKLMQLTGSSLIHRYQVEESLRSLKVMSQPVYLMLLVYSIYSFLSFLVQLYATEIYPPTLHFLVEALIFIPVYSLIFVIIFLRKERCNKIQSIQSINQKIHTTPEVYFDSYKTAWN